MAPQARRILVIGGLTAVYVAAGRFGLSLALINKSTSAVWLPTGIAIAALLLIGTYTWPAIAVGSFSRVLLDLPPNDERLKRATQAINRNLLVQARLVSDIIDVSRGAGGRLRLKRAAVDVTPIVNAAIGALRETAAAHRIALETTLPVTPAMVTGDAERLQQVVCNLVENAIKFSPDGTVVHVSVVRVEDSMEINVADGGPGIDPAFLPYVFDEFRQPDESLTRSHGGLGLGLAIARQIVQQHGGTIRASNRPEGGALFTVTLPLDDGLT